MTAPPVPLRLAIVNDYEIVVAGLATVLAAHDPRIRVIELNSRVPADSDVDIVLLDTFAFASGGLVEVSELVRHAQGSSARVVVYSWVTDPTSVRAALADGASGHLWKGLATDELIEALEAVRAGEVVTRGPSGPPDAPPGPGAEAFAPDEGRWPGREHGLSTREAEVVALIAKGLSNEDVADELYLGINTVKTYIRTAYRKMGVTSRTQAVLWALANGFDLQPRRVILGADEPAGPEPGGPCPDPVQELRRRAERVRALVPDLVGLTLASGTSVEPFTVAATSDEVAVLDAVQYLTDGPSRHAAEAGQVLACNRAELDHEPAWQSVAAAAAAVGVSSTLTVPVLHHRRVVGTINLYAAIDHAFDGRHREVADVFEGWAPRTAERATLPDRRTTVETMPQHLRDDLDIRDATSRTASQSVVPLRQARLRLDDAAHRAGITKARLATVILGIPPR